MTEMRHCGHSDWVVCEACEREQRRAALTEMVEIDEEMGALSPEAISLDTVAPAPDLIDEETVELVMRTLDAAHCDIWFQLKPKPLRRMAMQVVEALPLKMRSGPELHEALTKLVDDVDYLIGHSGGVYGLHLNDDPAPWDSLIVGGQFETWLLALEDARDALAKIRDEA